MSTRLIEQLLQQQPPLADPFALSHYQPTVVGFGDAAAGSPQFAGFTALPHHHPANTPPSTASNVSSVENGGMGAQTPHSTDVAMGAPLVPKCSICKAESTGIHFGTEACAACSAFFRRTVVLKKSYVCPRDNNCVVELDSANRKKCRACRFALCLKRGMDRSAVQGRRDAIGKYSSTFQRDSFGTAAQSPESPRMMDASPGWAAQCSNAPSTSVHHEDSQPLDSPPSSFIAPGPQLGIVLRELKYRYDELNRLRKVFYCQRSLKSLFDKDGELEPAEMTDLGESMFQLWRVEPRLCVDFIGNNANLRHLDSADKTRMFANFLLTFHAIEEPYLTWKHGGLTGEKKFWMMPNRVYLLFNKAEEYFEGEANVMKGLNLDKKSAIKLFKPSFQHAMEIVGEKMALLNISVIEIVGLIGITLYDPLCKDLNAETARHLQRLRNQLFTELMEHYRSLDIEEPEVRLGNLVMLLQGVKIHAMRSFENMQMLRVFNVVPVGELFDEIVGLTDPVT